jgi:hypothetical protein
MPANGSENARHFVVISRRGRFSGRPLGSRGAIRAQSRQARLLHGGPRVRHGARALFVFVVSPASPTTERLLTYLARCGVKAELRERLGDLGCDEDVTALVVFPDGLARDLDLEGARGLWRRFPRATLAVVTGEPRRYAAFSAALPGADARTCVVFPRPVWAHRLLDHVLASRRRGPSRGAGRSRRSEAAR